MSEEVQEGLVVVSEGAKQRNNKDSPPSKGVLPHGSKGSISIILIGEVLG